MQKICPLLKKACLEHKCMWYQHVLGKHPQSDAPLDHYNCAIVWTNVLLIEGNKETRGAAAAVESFRNETVKGAMGMRELVMQRWRQITHADQG